MIIEENCFGCEWYHSASISESKASCFLFHCTWYISISESKTTCFFFIVQGMSRYQVHVVVVTKDIMMSRYHNSKKAFLGVPDIMTSSAPYLWHGGYF